MTRWRDHHNDYDVSESLQSDVMRFMAILALCLVAVFALVRSIPFAPPGSAVEDAATRPAPATPAPETGATGAKADAQQRNMGSSVVSRSAAPTPTSGTTTSIRDAAPPRADTASKMVETGAAAPAPPVTSPESTLTLRFASDAALERLVARGDVGLYASWRGDAIWRLRARSGTLSFQRAARPPAFHTMTAETVPLRIVAALHRDAKDADGVEVTWGVTLPASMQRQLRALLHTHKTGSLAIQANGRIRVEVAPE